MEEFIEDNVTTKPVVKEPETLEIRGTASKYDPKGIIDENIRIRQQLARKVTEDMDKVVNDPDLLNAALKLMDANDKVVIATARLAVDEESNNANQELAKAIVAETIRRTDKIRREDNLEVIEHDEGYEPKGRSFELPEPTRDISDDELVKGTVVISDKDIMSTLKNNPAEE